MRQDALERLLIGPPPAPENVAPFVRHVLALFPRVREIECAGAEAGAAVSVDVAAVSKGEMGETENRKGTSDGCADGQ